MGAFRLLGKVQLGVAKGDVYVPALGSNQIAKVKTIWISNTDTVARATKLYYTPSGTTAGSTEELVPNSVMNANECVIITGELSLAPGDKIEGFAAAAAKVNVFVWGEDPAT